MEAQYTFARVEGKQPLGEAIVFGNKNDPNSRVSRLRAQQRSYGVIADQNTRPRTQYLAEVLNVNQELEVTPTEFAPAKG